MKKVILPIVLLLLALLSLLVERGHADEGPEPFRNPSFESELVQDEWSGWYAHPFTQRWSLDNADGDWSLYQSPPTDAMLTSALQVSNVENCTGESVWYHVCYQMRTNEPPEGGELDYCVASLYDERRLFIAELVSISNLDVIEPFEWTCNWYRVDGVPGVFQESTTFLDAWESGEQMSICLWDRVSGWCVKEAITIYLPVVYSRSGEGR